MPIKKIHFIKTKRSSPVSNFFKTKEEKAEGWYVPACQARTGRKVSGAFTTHNHRKVTCKLCRKTYIFKGFEPDMVQPSRQIAYQRVQKQKGRCITCAGPLYKGNSTYCQKHLEATRTRARNRKRLELGIPFDRPIENQGRPRSEDK